MASKKTLEHYLRQLRLIEEHREKWCEQNVRRHYKDLMTDLQEFLGVEYAQLAQDDKLTYEILHGKAQYARFLEEVERRTDKYTGQAAQDITNTVQLTYKKTFEGMVDAVEKSDTYEQLKINLKGLRAVTPDIIKNAVKNSFVEEALEKNHKAVIYDIKQQIGIGLSQGDRMSTMARRISEQLDKDYKKAVQIVRTECHRIREAGYQDSSERISQVLKDSDSDYVMVKTWKTLKDLSVRPYRRKGKKGFVKGKGPDHVKMHGVTVLVEDLFELEPGVKAKAPGQSGVAGHDINCRCYLSRDMMLKSEYEKMSGKKIAKDDLADKYEMKEKALLNDKENLEAQKAKLEQRKQNLESYEYDGLWKETVTPADYASKKDRIDAKRAYFEEQIYDAKHRMGKYANTDFYSDVDLENVIKHNQKYLDMLKEFEAQGKVYAKLVDELSDVSKKIIDIDDQVQGIRKKIMKAKGIDIDKMQEEIDDLVKQIDALKKISANANLSPVKLKVEDLDLKDVANALVETKEKIDISEWGNAWDIIPKEKYAKDMVNVAKTYKAYTLEELADDWYVLDSEKQVFLKQIKSIINPVNNVDVSQTDKAIVTLQKQLSKKQDELEKVRKRYGLEDNPFSQTRKDAAYWFTDKNGGSKGADNVLRDVCGEVWRNASNAQKNSAYEYTQSYHKYNEPLRGIEYGTSKFIGVGKIDLNEIGTNYGGYQRGQVKKLIDDLTDIIDESSYDFDYWVNRGCRYEGMDKFFGIDSMDFYNLTEDQMRNKLLGTTPTEYAFMSTGVSKGAGLNTSGEGITLNIYAPKGTKMLYCEPFSAFGHGDKLSWDGQSKQSSFGFEAEMLLQRNTKFRVTKVEKTGDRWYIDMEVISQER